MSKANNRAAADTFLAVALGLCLPIKMTESECVAELFKRYAKIVE